MDVGDLKYFLNQFPDDMQVTVMNPVGVIGNLTPDDLHTHTLELNDRLSGTCFGITTKNLVLGVGQKILVFAHY